MPGFPGKPKEISIRASTDNGVPGLNSGHCPNGAEAPSGEDIKICAESRSFMEDAHVSGRALARLEGKMNATIQVIPPAELFFFHHLQMALSDTLSRNSQCYEAQVPHTQYCKEELMWWDTHMIKWNGKSLLKKEVDLVIDSDASLIEWGAVC